ncbi:MAG: hypothetical protein KC492_22570, partial [Myxococcales bacterium]|nr:hypothetical protein [Myxococcales bacterium]
MRFWGALGACVFAVSARAQELPYAHALDQELLGPKVVEQFGAWSVTWRVDGVTVQSEFVLSDHPGFSMDSKDRHLGVLTHYGHVLQVRTRAQGSRRRVSEPTVLEGGCGLARLELRREDRVAAFGVRSEAVPRCGA